MASEVTIAREGGVQPLNAQSVANARQKLKHNYREYLSYYRNKDYREAYFDNRTGGWLATHKGHNSDHNSNDKDRFFGSMTKEDLERECQLEIVRMGGSVIFRDENKKRTNKETAVALDAVINGHLTDIRSITKNKKNYKNALESKNEQLSDWNKENPREKGHTITLYFHDPSMFSEPKIRRGIKGLKKTKRHGLPVQIEFTKVLAVVKGHDRIYEIDV